MDILPLAIAAVPHPGLLRLHGARHATRIHVLSESNVGDAGCIFPNKVHVWIQEDGMHRLVPFGQRWEGDKVGDYSNSTKYNTY